MSGAHLRSVGRCASKITPKIMDNFPTNLCCIADVRRQGVPGGLQQRLQRYHAVVCAVLHDRGVHRSVQVSGRWFHS